MSLATIMNMQITVQSRAPSRAGFGTPLLLGFHNAWAARVREYEQPDEMLEDGFLATDDLYLAARTVKSQNPSPKTFKIGRRATALTQVVEITPTIAIAGHEYTGTVGGKALSYVVPASPAPTVATVSTALAAALGALSVGGTAVASATKVTFTASTPGKVVAFDLGPGADILDATVDTTTDDELFAIRAVDDDWYGLVVVDSQSKATALLQAAWIEAVRKISIVQTADSNAADGTATTDTLSALAPYARTGGIYHRAIGGTEWLAAGWLAGQLTTTPGSATAAFKEVRTVSVDKLSTSQESAILAKHGSHYTRTGGLPVTFEGKSGAAEYLDTTRGVDWLYARMQERIIFALANNPKIPFTDSGVDILRTQILAVLQQGIKAGLLAADPEPTVSAPLVKDVDPTERINRILPDVEFAAYLAGAIHRLDPVRGRISV
jgi:hypothetical protein